MEKFRNFLVILCMLSKLKETKCLSFLGSETYHHASHLGFYKIDPKLFRCDLLPLKNFVLDMHIFPTKLFWGRLWVRTSKAEAQ